MNVVEPAALDYMVTPCNHLYHQQCLVKVRSEEPVTILNTRWS